MTRGSLKQDRDRGGADEAFVVGREPVVAGGDVAELLELAEGALDETALLIKKLVMLS